MKPKKVIDHPNQRGTPTPTKVLGWLECSEKQRTNFEFYSKTV